MASGSVGWAWMLWANSFTVASSAMAIAPDARSRLNTVVVVSNFLGGAIGSYLAGIIWDRGGWPLLSGAAAVLALFALVVWLVGRSRLQRA